MKTYRLRFERWERGLHKSRWAPTRKDIQARTLLAGLKLAQATWDDIVRKEGPAVRFTELVEVLDWAPKETAGAANGN